MAKKVEFTIPNFNLQKVMMVALVIMAFVIGMLYQKVQTLQGAQVAGANATNQPAAQQQATAAPVAISAIKDLWNKDLIKFGDANKKLLFVEIADPSCPYCHAASGSNHTIYQSLGATFQLTADGGSYVAPVTEMHKLVDSGQAGFVYLYFPGHGNGEMGMKALYCANEKGKFWEAEGLLMSDAGYTLMNTTVKNDKTQSQAVANFLKGVVDAAFMKSCLDSGKYDNRLASDTTLANGFAQNFNGFGTPSFFVNTTSYAGAYNWTQMKAGVDAALK